MDRKRLHQPTVADNDSTARPPKAALIALVRLLARQAAAAAFAEALVRNAKEQDRAEQKD